MDYLRNPDKKNQLQTEQRRIVGFERSTEQTLASISSASREAWEVGRAESAKRKYVHLAEYSKEWLSIGEVSAQFQDNFMQIIYCFLHKK